MTAPILSVMVSAFNEAANLPTVVDEIEAELRAAGVPYEVVIIDDGSTDDTPEVCRCLESQSRYVRVVRHALNQGLGGVYRTGFDEARGDFVTFLPGDGQFAPGHVLEFAGLMADADMVLGYLPPSGRPVIGRLLSFCEQALHRAVLGKLPRFQGILMFRRSLLSDIVLQSRGRGWGILFELILKVHRAGYRVCSVPTGLRPRLSGSSKVNNLRTIAGNLAQVIELRRHLSEQ
jgi:dolichol-phosphate mannosyltransferase